MQHIMRRAGVEGLSMATWWVSEEEKAPKYRQRKRDAKEADKVKVAPGGIAESWRLIRAALMEPTQGLPKRRRLHQR